MDMVEKVARAICAAQGWSWLPREQADRSGDFCDEDYLAHARAALEALREPTEVMMRCLYVEEWPSDAERGKQVQREVGDRLVPFNTEAEIMMGQYQRMIDAALSPSGDR